MRGLASSPLPRWSYLWSADFRPLVWMMLPSGRAFQKAHSISILTVKKICSKRLCVGIVSRIAEAEQRIREYTGATADLMRDLVHDWWQQIGSTKLAGISKLMMSEAGNFPELAKFYHAEVMQRGTGLFASVIQRGIDAGEFRPVSLEFAPRIACAPVVMLMLWRNSFDLCSAVPMDPIAYLDAHTDMLLHSLSVRPVSLTAAQPTTPTHSAVATKRIKP